mgnify:CR=1 FL=1
MLGPYQIGLDYALRDSRNAQSFQSQACSVLRARSLARSALCVLVAFQIVYSNDTLAFPDPYFVKHSLRLASSSADVGASKLVLPNSFVS